MTIYALPPLPYPKNALAPHLSAESFDYHHGKHHAAYVSKLNELLAGHPWADMPLANLIVEAANRPDFPNARGIYNNAAQHWNHAQFWTGMKPNGGGAMPSELEKLVRVNFGTEAKFRQEFIAAAVGQFGSGWAWLVEKDGRLEIRATSNADTPLTDSARPLIGCDVWEHAYYIDHRNARASFVTAYLHSLVNWEEAARRLTEPAL